MKRSLQIAAFLIFLVAGGYWFAAGANRGWTKTSVPVKKLDEVTGIEGTDYQRRFVPGLDFLGAAATGAVVLAGLSLFVRKSPTKTEIKP